jgi:hypothetical protein
MNAATDKADTIRRLLAESRNGMNCAIRYNPMTPRFIISDGVELLAKTAGCYWLLDILATELEPKLLTTINEGEVTTALVTLYVYEDRSAKVIATTADDVPPFWTKDVASTDFPAGQWLLFELGAFEWDWAAQRAKNVIAILLSEH